MNPSYDDYADSDEDQHDAYLERMKEEGKIREENANDSSDDSGEETGGLASAVPGRGGGQALPVARASCLVKGVGFPRGKADESCVLFQMSHSTQVKRRKTWQRSEFWFHLLGVRWWLVSSKGPEISGHLLCPQHKPLTQGRKVTFNEVIGGNVPTVVKGFVSARHVGKPEKCSGERLGRDAAPAPTYSLGVLGSLLTLSFSTCGTAAVPCIDQDC